MSEVSSKTRSRPSYELEEVGDELPEKEEAATRQSAIYDNLVAIKETPGKWFAVAKYVTPNGAKQAYERLIERGANDEDHKVIPSGEFELEVRTHRLDGQDRRGSKLYAKFIG